MMTKRECFTRVLEILDAISDMLENEEFNDLYGCFMHELELLDQHVENNKKYIKRNDPTADEIAQAIMTVMQDGQARTTQEIARALDLNATISQVTYRTSALVNANKLVRTEKKIVDNYGVHRIKFFELGGK